MPETIKKASDLRVLGTNPGDTRDERVQKLEQFLQIITAPKGDRLLVSVVNNHAENAQDFLLFDTFGCAASSHSKSTGANIAFTTSFPGGYTGLRAFLGGCRVPSLGLKMEVSHETIFNTAGIKIYNGNLEDYTSKSLDVIISENRDAYTRDPKSLFLKTKNYLNGFYAISGNLKAGERISFLFTNIADVGNF